MRKDFFATKVKSMLIIAPKKSLIKKIVDALNLIKKVDPIEYKNLFSRLNIVFVTNKNNSTNDFYMPEKCWFTNKIQISHSSLPWIASSLLHEGFHATQFINGKWILPPIGEMIEEPAVEFEIKFLEKIGCQEDIDHLRRQLKEKFWSIKRSKDITSFVYFRNLQKSLKEDKLELTYIKNAD